MPQEQTMPFEEKYIYHLRFFFNDIIFRKNRIGFFIKGDWNLTETMIKFVYNWLN